MFSAPWSFSHPSQNCQMTEKRWRPKNHFGNCQQVKQKIRTCFRFSNSYACFSNTLVLNIEKVEKSMNAHHFGTDCRDLTELNSSSPVRTTKNPYMVSINSQD